MTEKKEEMTGKERNDRKKKKIRENPCKSMRKKICVNLWNLWDLNNQWKNLWESVKSVGLK